MPKLKTNKAAAKRILTTKTGKQIKRVAGQDHFNARERGKTKMNKRRDVLLSKSASKMIKTLLPYS
ncbi:MAG: 50S ribosomal protein L35 [Parcubacteria group bacterium]|nr:50S ribosomal protein L35 [Parcubacteria group bacterium]